MLEVVRRAADVGVLLRTNADKESVNTAAIARPELLAEMARAFGSQCVALSVNARTAPAGLPPTPSGWQVTTQRGRLGTAIEWAARGGCRAEHFAPAVVAGADAVLTASVFHFRQLSIGQVKGSHAGNP